MTGTLKLFKRTQSEIEDGEPTTKAAAASVTTPETAYNAVPYSPESRISARYSLCGAFVCPQSYKINMISVRKKAGLTHESTYGSLFVSERASNTHRLFAGKGAPTLRQAQCTASSATGNTVSNTDEITGLST